MKSHLSLACLDSISLCLIVLTLSLALSGPLWPYVYVRLQACLSVSVYCFILVCLYIIILYSTLHMLSDVNQHLKISMLL